MNLNRLIILLMIIIIKKEIMNYCIIYTKNMKNYLINIIKDNNIQNKFKNLLDIYNKIINKYKNKN